MNIFSQLYKKIFKEKYILSTLPLTFLIGFFLFPFMIMVLISFSEPGYYNNFLSNMIVKEDHKYHFNIHLTNFSYIFQNNFILWLLFRSVFFSIITTLLCLLLGYPIALLISRSSYKLKFWLILLVVIPLWTSLLIRVYAWMVILSPESFISIAINKIGAIFGLAHIELMYSSFAVIICMIYVNLPFMIFPIWSNLEKHDKYLIEASKDLGAKSWQSFWFITFRMSLPAVFAGCAMVFIPCMGMFVIPDLVGDRCSNMIGNLIKQQFLEIMHWPLGSATSIMMTLVIIVICVIITLIAKYFKVRVQ